MTIQQLRRHASEVVDRAAQGEEIAVVRDGRPIAKLCPIAPPALRADELLGRWRHLPTVDPAALRTDILDLCGCVRWDGDLGASRGGSA